MQWHVDIAGEVDEERKRFEPDIVGQFAARKHIHRPLDLAVDARPAGAIAARIVILADRSGLVMPGGGVAPAIEIAAHAIGPDRRVLQCRQRAVGRAEQRRGLEQTLDLGAGLGRHVFQRDTGGDAVGVEAPGLRRGGDCKSYERRDQSQEFHCAWAPSSSWPSYCWIAHSSSSAAAIHSRIQSCSHTACI